MAKTDFFSDLIHSGFSLYLDHSCFVSFSDVSFSVSRNSYFAPFDVRDSSNCILFFGSVQISRNYVCVSRINYYNPLSIKLSPDELFLSVPYVSHKYRKLSTFLYHFHLALNSCLSEYFYDHA